MHHDCRAAKVVWHIFLLAAHNHTSSTLCRRTAREESMSPRRCDKHGIPCCCAVLGGWIMELAVSHIDRALSPLFFWWEILLLFWWEICPYKRRGYAWLPWKLMGLCNLKKEESNSLERGGLSLLVEWDGRNSLRCCGSRGHGMTITPSMRAARAGRQVGGRVVCGVVYCVVFAAHSNSV